MARSSIAPRWARSALSCCSACFALDAQGVLDLALLGEQLDLLDPRCVVSLALLRFDLGEPALDRGERLELLERDRDGLGTAGGGGTVATAGAAPPGGFIGHGFLMWRVFSFSVFSVRFHHRT